MQPDSGGIATDGADDRDLDLAHERDEAVRQRGHAPLDAADPRACPATGVACHDVGAPAEVLAGPSEQHRSDRLVAVGLVERADQRLHHGVVDGVALVRPVERQPQNAVRQCHSQPVDTVVAHDPYRSLMAASTALRSLAPPGTSGSRTAPWDRLGSSTVAWPGVVTSPRWLTHSRSRSTAGRSPSARYLRVTFPR